MCWNACKSISRFMSAFHLNAIDKIQFWLLNPFFFFFFSLVAVTKFSKNYKVKLVTKALAMPTSTQVTCADGTSLSVFAFKSASASDTNKLSVSLLLEFFQQTDPGLVLTSVRPRASSALGVLCWGISGLQRPVSVGCTTARKQRLSHKKKALLKLPHCLFTLVSRPVCLTYWITTIVGSKKKKFKKNFPCFVLPGQRLGQFRFLASWILDGC